MEEQNVQTIPMTEEAAASYQAYLDMVEMQAAAGVAPDYEDPEDSILTEQMRTNVEQKQKAAKEVQAEQEKQIEEQHKANKEKIEQMKADDADPLDIDDADSLNDAMYDTAKTASTMAQVNPSEKTIRDAMQTQDEMLGGMKKLGTRLDNARVQAKILGKSAYHGATTPVRLLYERSCNQRLVNIDKEIESQERQLKIMREKIDAKALARISKIKTQNAKIGRTTQSLDVIDGRKRWETLKLTNMSLRIEALLFEKAKLIDHLEVSAKHQSLYRESIDKCKTQIEKNKELLRQSPTRAERKVIKENLKTVKKSEKATSKIELQRRLERMRQVSEQNKQKLDRQMEELRQMRKGIVKEPVAQPQPEPEMPPVRVVVQEMTEEEKERTLQFIKEQEAKQKERAASVVEKKSPGQSTYEQYMEKAALQSCTSKAERAYDVLNERMTTGDKYQLNAKSDRFQVMRAPSGELEVTRWDETKKKFEKISKADAISSFSKDADTVYTTVVELCSVKEKSSPDIAKDDIGDGIGERVR